MLKLYFLNTMRKIILTLNCFLFLFFSCKQNENKEKISINNASSIIEKINLSDFVGEWEMESNSKNGSDTFSINFSKSSKGILEGYYCAVARNGGKIDCTTDKEINITEVKKEDEGYLVSFKSFFGAKDGVAKISIKNDKVFWQVIKKPIGEFYCPLEAYLTKKNPAAISTNNSDNTLNINSENYKGGDITMQLYKNIIDEYGCGENSVIGKSLGKYKNYEIFIVENDCGDFPFKDLISVDNGKIVDKLTIESSSFDIEKSENQNQQDQTDDTYELKSFSNIQIKEIHSVNNKIESNKTNKYLLNGKGKFIKNME